jgi:hypothetical protein
MEINPFPLYDRIRVAVGPESNGKAALSRSVFIKPLAFMRVG